MKNTIFALCFSLMIGTALIFFLTLLQMYAGK
jgi:hypothetical protein